LPDDEVSGKVKETDCRQVVEMWNAEVNTGSCRKQCIELAKAFEVKGIFAVMEAGRSGNGICIAEVLTGPLILGLE
jgi:hypothetical protein